MCERKRICAYLDAVAKILNMTKGHRHLTLVYLASLMNKNGFDLFIAIEECIKRFAQPDFDENEIRETISDIYQRNSSEHGSNQKAFTPKTDKKTKGQIDTSKETEEEPFDEEDILNTPCPDISKAKKYIDDNIYGWVIDSQSGRVIQMAAFCALMVSMGATMKNVKCRLLKKEVVGTTLFFVINGAAASGKSCIEPCRNFIRGYAQEIENKSREEIRQQEEAHKAWEKCLKKCEEEDCGCGAEPVIPMEKSIELSLDVTPSRLKTQIVDNGDTPLYLATSELAANMNTKEVSLSPILRMAYSGEPIMYQTHKWGNKKNYHPKLAFLGAGTPEQVVDLYKNKEDGLTSRTSFINLPDSTYKPLGTDDDFDFHIYEAEEEAFERRALTFHHYAASIMIDFILTKKSRQFFDNYFIEAEKHYAPFASDALTSYQRRLRSMDAALAMILATSDHFNNNKGSGTYEIPDEIIELVISWNDFLIEQHIRVLNMLPEPQVNKDSNELKYPELLKKLPCEFTCKEACQIAKSIIEISDRNLRRVLNKWKDHNLLTKRGKIFHKVDCQKVYPKA